MGTNVFASNFGLNSKHVQRHETSLKPRSLPKKLAPKARTFPDCIQAVQQRMRISETTCLLPR